MEPESLQEWVGTHEADYRQTRVRLDATRNVVLHGRREAAESVLRKAYVFAVLSIQTEKERHERAFTAHYTGDMDRKEAALETVYGGNKSDWMSRTFDSVDWTQLVSAVRKHVEHGRFDVLLEVINDQLTGVAYRKAAFMLAMSGLYEYICIDSNVGRYADIGDRENFNSAQSYMETCREIVRETGVEDMKPFLVQWAIYDYERGEHARHMPFFREVLSL